MKKDGKTISAKEEISSAYPSAPPSAQPVQPPLVQPPLAPTIPQPQGEIGGTQGQEPTIFGDWQYAGRCSDF